MCKLAVNTRVSLLSFFIFYSFCKLWSTLFVSGCDGRTCLSCCSPGRRRGVTELELVTAGRRIETEVHIDKSKSAVTQVPSG